MDWIMILLTYIAFFVLGMVGEIIILKMQSSTSLKYDSDFAKNARLVLTIFMIISGLLVMFLSYWNLLTIPIGIVAIFLSEKWYYKMRYEKQNRQDKEYKKNIREVESEIEDYF